MLIYLDMCCVQRPLDDRTQVRIALEAEAVLAILALRQSGKATLVVSDALEFETDRNPDPGRKAHALGVLAKAGQSVPLSAAVEDQARQLKEAGVKPLDALHLAFAIGARADYFCTCDDRFAKRARDLVTPPPKVVNPLEFIAELEP